MSGKRILVWAEQGIGDEILHASMIGEVISRARACVVECSPRLAPIFTRSFPGASVVAVASSAQTATPPETVDLQIPISSLGRYLRPDFASFPRHSGYLRADAEKTASLRARYQAMAPGRKLIGISWRSANVKVGEFKSMSALDLAPILATPGAAFVNLQYGDCAAEIAAVKRELAVEIIQDPEINPLTDMDGFFAQVAAMDLVISSSNTTVHAAGAQNVPVWVLLPEGKGVLWYWFTNRSDSPWYPSANLIRASRIDPDRPWAEVTTRAAQDLASWLRSTP